HRALVVINRISDVALAEHQVADAVEERNVQLACVLIEVVEKLDVHSERFREIPLELELCRLFLELRDVGHQRPGGVRNGIVLRNEVGFGPVKLLVSDLGDKFCLAPTSPGSDDRRTSMATL